MIVAEIREGQQSSLDALLNGMNQSGAPGMANPANELFPFGEFNTLHFARFVIVDDRTLGDFAELGVPIPDYPIHLAFIVSCDGPTEDQLQAFAAHPVAGAGLRKIFSHCGDFPAGTDLVEWMNTHEQPPAASYVNWVGRTVKQVRSEASLQAALQTELSSYRDEHPDNAHNVLAIRRHLRNFAAQNPGLIPPSGSPTPVSWQVENILHFAIVPALLLLPWVLVLPFLIPPPLLFWWVMIPTAAFGAFIFTYLAFKTRLTLAIIALAALFLIPFFILFPLLLIPIVLSLAGFIIALRYHEKTEPEVIPIEPCEQSDRRLAALAEREDYDVTNQFTVIGSLKPGTFRLWLSSVLLWLINYGARHIYNRSHIGRIQTIHFASWTFIDDKKRLIFASNYDGTTEAYMDDFINKVGWGLNLAFGGGVGYPRVNWLILDGAKEEQKFKYTLRRHQLPTEVWYKAYSGLTAYDLARNARVHEGIKRGRMSDGEIRAWLRDL